MRSLMQYIVFILLLIFTNQVYSQGQLYWASIESELLSSSSLATPQTNILLSSGFGQAMALDTLNQRVYWLFESDKTQIKVSNYDGTEQSTFVELGDVGVEDIGIDIVNQVLYWSADAALYSQSITGPAVINTVISGYNRLDTFDFDFINGHIYVIAELDIIRHDLDGSNPTVIRDDFDAIDHIEVSAENGYLFFLRFGQSIRLLRTDLSGNNQVFIGTEEVDYFQVIGNTLYQQLEIGRETIWQSDLDGANSSAAFTFNLTEPSGINYFQIDETANLVFAQYFSLNMIKTDSSGNDPANLMAFAREVHDVAVDPDGEFVILSDQGFGLISTADANGDNGFTPYVERFEFSSDIRGIVYDVESGLLYWVNPDAGFIGQVALDGSGQIELVSGLSAPHDLALDATTNKLYWTENIDSSGTGGMIRSADLDGNNVVTVLTNLDRRIRGIDIDSVNQRLYFTDMGNNQIWRVDADGNNLTAIAASTRPHDVAVDVNTNTIYWTENIGDGNGEVASIRCSDLDGDGATDFITGLTDYIRDLTVVYFTDVIFTDGFDAAGSNCPMSN